MIVKLKKITFYSNNLEAANEVIKNNTPSSKDKNLWTKKKKW